MNARCCDRRRPDLVWSDHQTDDGGCQSMSIRGMNHAVLYVRDAAAPPPVLRRRARVRHGHRRPRVRSCSCGRPASPNHHDIAFFTIGDGGRTVGRRADRRSGMYHLAWEVADARRARRDARHGSTAAGALVGASDHHVNKSLYCRDPDGLEFEVMWLTPPENWGAEEHEAIVRAARPRPPTARATARPPACSPMRTTTGRSSEPHRTSTATSSTTPSSARPTGRGSGAASSPAITCSCASGGSTAARPVRSCTSTTTTSSSASSSAARSTSGSATTRPHRYRVVLGENQVYLAPAVSGTATACSSATTSSTSAGSSTCSHRPATI